MANVGSNAIYCRVLEKNAQYKQKLGTVDVNNKRLLVCRLWIIDVINKLQFFIFSWLNKLYILDRPILSLCVHPLPNINPYDIPYNIGYNVYH